MLSNCFLGNYRLMVLNGSNTGGIKTKKSKPKRSALLWHNKLYFHEFTREVFVESSEDFSFATSEARRLADFSFLYFFIPWLTR